jgi:hypothetical protein
VERELVEKLLQQLADLDRKVSALVSEKTFDSKVPLDIRECAEVCHVEVLWLRERISRKEIPGYRNGKRGNWRVYPKDVIAYLTANNNQRPVRRKSILRNVA